MNVYHWFLSLKRHHDTDVEQVLKTEFIVVMFFCCTFVKLSFFLFFFAPSWADGPCCPIWHQILLGEEEEIWKMWLHGV